MEESELERSGLSIRALNALHRGGIFGADEIRAMPPERLAAIKGIGKVSIEEIRRLIGVGKTENARI